MKVCIKSYYFNLALFSDLVRVVSVALGDGGHVSCYEMVDIESKLGLGRNSLVSLFILLCPYVLLGHAHTCRCYKMYFSSPNAHKIHICTFSMKPTKI